MKSIDPRGSLEQVTRDDFAAPRARSRKQRGWGPWTIDLRDARLVYQRGEMEYFVPVDEMTDSAQILDWIFQVNEKSWASRDDVGHLVEAIEDMLGRDVAGGGVDQPIDPVKLLADAYGVSPA
ncbi:hypothetical protein QH494_15400 [Sphingomonas sp. AR_OL41]|uniref:hypothetical protein n=1 Tax=Sphingomonas sp. AR_OL41 TaxID=3042729 RepID=UPI00247FDAFE|nr:hypothetical protein [Sphingomonas sp. AR_OL41]MDH7973576.1 hypothetical protein [Sphingomonas sp. AR_OL41]